MPSLCGSAHEWFRTFAARSFLACRPLCPRDDQKSCFSSLTIPTWPSPRSERLGSSGYPAIRFKQGSFAGLIGSPLLRPVRLLAPLDGSDRVVIPATRAFTSRLSMSQSPFSLLDITTTDSGLFCRWDSHPLERQLASLHRIRTSGIPASGSCLR
jgi:hypothetical protein